MILVFLMMMQMGCQENVIRNAHDGHVPDATDWLGLLFTAIHWYSLCLHQLPHAEQQLPHAEQQLQQAQSARLLSRLLMNSVKN